MLSAVHETNSLSSHSLQTNRSFNSSSASVSLHNSLLCAWVRWSLTNLADDHPLLLFTVPLYEWGQSEKGQ